MTEGGREGGERERQGGRQGERGKNRKIFSCREWWRGGSKSGAREWEWRQYERWERQIERARERERERARERARESE